MPDIENVHPLKSLELSLDAMTKASDLPVSAQRLLYVLYDVFRCLQDIYPRTPLAQSNVTVPPPLHQDHIYDLKVRALRDVIHFVGMHGPETHVQITSSTTRPSASYDIQVKILQGWLEHYLELCEGGSTKE